MSATTHPAMQRHIPQDLNYTPVTTSKLASFIPLNRHSVTHKYTNSFYLSQNIYLFQAFACHLTPHHNFLPLTFDHLAECHVFTFMLSVIGWNNQYAEHGWSLYCVSEHQICLNESSCSTSPSSPSISLSPLSS